MKLYYFDVLNPRKTCAAARYLRSPVDYVHVDLGKGEHKTAAYRALNPNGRVPSLVDGDRTLWESNAIMCHLAMRAGSDFWPRDDRQIEVLRWLSWDMQHFSAHGGDLYFEHVIRSRFNLGAPNEEALEKASKSFREFALILDDHLADRDVVVGNDFTVADFALGATLPWAEQARLPLDGLRNIARWRSNLESLDAWNSPYPAREPQSV